MTKSNWIIDDEWFLEAVYLSSDDVALCKRFDYGKTVHSDQTVDLPQFGSCSAYHARLYENPCDSRYSCVRFDDPRQ